MAVPSEEPELLVSLESEDPVVEELKPVCVAVVPEVPVEVNVAWVAVAPLPPQKWEL